jgi:hypothetical protein
MHVFFHNFLKQQFNGKFPYLEVKIRPNATVKSVTTIGAAGNDKF